MATRPGFKHNFVCEKGATFSETVNIALAGSSVDLTGYTVEMDVRLFEESGTEVITLTTANSRVDVSDVANGNVTLTIADTDTDDLSIGSYTYDLRIESSGGTASFPLYGQFDVIPTTTR